jgi:hypothetical protein
VPIHFELYEMMLTGAIAGGVAAFVLRRSRPRQVGPSE